MKEIKESPNTDAVLASIKRGIEEAYTTYRSDLSSKRHIEHLAAYFAIPIDVTRLEDYYVRGIDFETPSISIVDKKTNIVYRANYTYHSKLNSVLDCGLSLEVFSNRDNVQIQSLYRVSSDEKTLLEPFTSELIITHGELALAFEKIHTEEPNNREGNQKPFTISLQKSCPNYDDVRNRQPLYTKTLTSPFCKAAGGLREEIALSPTTTISWQRLISPKIADLYYSINRTTESSHISGYVREIDRRHLTNILTRNELIHLTEFANSPTNILKVYKNEFEIQIEWQLGFGPIHFWLPNSTKGTLTPAELKRVIDTLQNNAEDDEFIREVTLELREFGRRLCIHRGLECEPEDILDPQKFRELSFDEIQTIILNDIDGYFAYAIEEYEKQKNRLSNSEQSISYTIKPIE